MCTPRHWTNTLSKYLSFDSRFNCPAVACGPFPQQLNRDALFKARGDMHAGEIKAVKEVISVRQELPLLVEEGAAPELYKAAADDAVEVGPFEVRAGTST